MTYTTADVEGGINTRADYELDIRNAVNNIIGQLQCNQLNMNIVYCQDLVADYLNNTPLLKTDEQIMKCLLFSENRDIAAIADKIPLIKDNKIQFHTMAYLAIYQDIYELLQLRYINIQPPTFFNTYF